MPRPRAPPTPSMSKDISAKEKSVSSEMENVFVLPPPAMSSSSTKSNVSKSYLQAISNGQVSPPASPGDGKPSPTLSRKRTLSESTKSKPNLEAASQSTQEAATLPPPPSRARKIIQMKPKQTSSNMDEQISQFPAKAPSSQNRDAIGSPTTTKRKQAQPSAGSAAGRKIARKTAHSVIERRRRSKMNEEFGVLKDMIPACAGIEMHKLAILQAGIEYLRYLEDCIEQLKSQNESLQTTQHTKSRVMVDEDDSDDELMDIDSRDESDRHEAVTALLTKDLVRQSSLPTVSAGTSFRPRDQKLLSPSGQSSADTSAANSTTASPILHSQKSSHAQNPDQHSSIAQNSNSHTAQIHGSSSISPSPLVIQSITQTGVSPAIGAFHLTPDLTRTPTSVSTSGWSTINGHSASRSHDNPSPSIVPLPQAALPFSNSTIHPILPLPSGVQMIDNSNNEMCAEATATAALMMMMTRKERRDSKSVGTSPTTATTTTTATAANANLSKTSSTSGKGMSVRDLLSS